MSADPDAAARTSRIFILRHGETEWSRTGKHTGVTDVALTETGERLARELSGTIGRHTFALVLASPRQRAARTAELAGFTDVVTDENLTEWDYGAYEGLTTPEIESSLGRDWNVWDDGVPPGPTPGESAADIHRRVDAVARRIMPVLDAGGDVLLVAHGHILRAFASVWLSLPVANGQGFALDTGTVSELGFEHDRPVILNWNRPPG